MNNVALVAEGENCAAHEFSIHTLPGSVNRLLAGRQAAVDYKRPWDFVFEFKDSLDFGRAGLITQNASEGGDFAHLNFFLPLLDNIRTFFKENPDADF